MDNIEPLNVPGARQSVEIENPHGILYKIRVGGDVVKRQRNTWYIPMRRGKDAKIKARGLIPGFQVLNLDGERIYDMGAGVGRLERITMFAPLLLIFWIPFGLLLGLILFLFGIPLVKNLDVPRPFRIAVPIINLLAVGGLLFLFTGKIGIWG